MLSPLLATGLGLLIQIEQPVVSPFGVLPTSDSVLAPREDLRVLVWNAWRGGNEVDQGPEKVLRVVREVEPDLVLMQESYDIDGERPTLGRWIAAELGWSAHQGESPHLCVLAPSEFEANFFHHPWHGVGVQITDDHGRSFQAWTAWLDYRAYIPYRLRDEPEISDAALIALESEGSNRLPQAIALLDAVDAQAQAQFQAQAQPKSGVPVLVGGDFNTPSHLDWTVDASRVYRHRRALDLPVSRLFAERGFTDCFRAVHPSPVHVPGITWTPLFRGAGEEQPATFDRIDRLYLRNPESAGWVLNAQGAETLPRAWEDDSVPARERRFPSDHGAVVIDLTWKEVTPESQWPTQFTYTLPGTPEQVWAALTQIDELNQWFFSELEDFSAEPGFEANFTADLEDTQYEHHLHVLTAEPNKELLYTWEYPGHAGSSQVQWKLSPWKSRSGVTTLHFTQTIQASFPDTPTFSRKARQDGWLYFLNSLRSHLKSKVR